MENLAFKSLPPKGGFTSGFKNYVEKRDSSGRIVLVECSDPYEGLSADSFGLQAQLDAGVPMEHISPISPSGLSSIDRNNKQAELFMQQFNKPKVPQMKE